MNPPPFQCRPAEILLVEDNLCDAILTREAFARAKLMVNLHHVEDGEACMAFLRKEPPYADAPPPDLVLLDINLPLMDGREVMAELAADVKLKHLPVVVLTTSDHDASIEEMYRLGCNSYIVKPVDFEQFQRVIKGIGSYWFSLVVLPNKA